MKIGSVEYASRVKEYSERMKELEAERNELQERQPNMLRSGCGSIHS